MFLLTLCFTYLNADKLSTCENSFVLVQVRAMLSGWTRADLLNAERWVFIQVQDLDPLSCWNSTGTIY